MIEALIVLFCLIVNALLAAYEMAFVSVSKPELRRLARGGSEAARFLASVRERPERTLSTIQTGITLVGFLAAAVGGVGAAESLKPYIMRRFGASPVAAEALTMALVVLPLTFVNVVFGELVPKTLAIRNPSAILLVGTPWLILVDRIFSPFVFVLEWSTKKILRTFFRRPKAEPVPQTTVEIDALSPAHQQYVLNMADIERKKVKDFLVPWSEVELTRATDSADEVASRVFRSGHTRLPVVEHGEQGRVVGILHTKEFLAMRETGDRNWQAIIRPPLTVQATESALGVLRVMQAQHKRMAIVMAERILGIVTTEDIIEEVVGDIYDEDDDGRIRKLLASKARSRWTMNRRASS